MRRALIFSAIGLAIVGCGGGGSPSRTGTSGTPPDEYLLNPGATYLGTYTRTTEGSVPKLTAPASGDATITVDNSYRMVIQLPNKDRLSAQLDNRMGIGGMSYVYEATAQEGTTYGATIEGGATYDLSQGTITLNFDANATEGGKVRYVVIFQRS